MDSPLVFSVHRRVAAALRASSLAHAPWRRVVLGCSGGPDSQVLFAALTQLKAELRLELLVACVDHRRRRESAKEALAVQQLAARHGLSGYVLTLDKPPASMEAARAARYQALLGLAQRENASAVLVAHTATDQAETMLDRLLRGAGSRGLSAMRRERQLGDGVQLIRPLLDVSRAEVEAYVQAQQLSVVQDPSNSDVYYRRSRIRQSVLPLLRQERPALEAALSATCDRLRQDADALDQIADGIWQQSADPRQIAIADLHAWPTAIAVRVIKRAAAVPLEARHIESLLRLCSQTGGSARLDLPGQICAERSYATLRFRTMQTLADPGEIRLELTLPGAYQFIDTVIEIDESWWRERVALGALFLRNYRLETPPLRAGGRRLSRLFADRRIGALERRRLPMVVRQTEHGDEVLWISDLFGIGPALAALTHGDAVQ